MIGVVAGDLHRAPRSRDAERDAAINHSARDEILRIDGACDLGANLEQSDALIRAAFELAGSLPSRD